MPDTPSLPTISVSKAEDGMKLFLFLQRKLEEQFFSSLHKWIRTGQVRINGKRAKAFDLLTTGDSVRVPPFAVPPPVPEEALRQTQKTSTATLQQHLGNDIPILFRSEDLLALNKPGGLPVQPGTGVTDCITVRLHNAFSGHPYIPAPAHRIDRHTSGVLLVGLTHQYQKQLHAWFAEEASIRKEYLAWVAGEWDLQEGELLVGHESITGALLEDALEKRLAGKSFEKVQVVEQGGHAARSIVRLLGHGIICGKKMSLLTIRLLTGKTHQIRVQLASRGYPIIGDSKHGGIRQNRMFLHSWRISLPDGISVTAPPPWEDAFSFVHAGGQKN